MGILVLVKHDLASVPTPAAGRASFIVDEADNKLKLKDEDGTTAVLLTTDDVGVGVGNVIGPASSVDNRVALFDGTTGELLKQASVLISELAPLASPALTGTPTAPTAAPGTNTTQVATTAFTTAAIAAIPQAMIYKGAWNASTNTPTLAGGVGSNGDEYRVSVAGNQDLGGGAQDYNPGDSVVYNSATGVWDFFDNSQAAVTSGEVVTALGYTPARTFPQVNALGNISGAVNIDCNYKFHTATLTGNVTFTFTNPPPSGCVAEVNVQLTQDGTGGRTISHAGTVKWPNGVPIDGSIMAASQRADISYVVDNSANATGYPVENVA